MANHDGRSDLEQAAALLAGIRSRKAKTSVAKLTKMVDSFDWESWENELKPKLMAQYRIVAQEQGKRAAARLGTRFDLADPFTQKAMTAYVGERIVELTGTSKDRVVDLLRDVLDAEGAGAQTTSELGDKIEEKVREQWDGYEGWRADRIARSETAIAYNHGTVFAGRQAKVTKYEVSDGGEDESHEDYDCDCAEVDGEIWTEARCLAEPIAHPNCVRAFSPIPPGDEDEDGE